MTSNRPQNNAAGLPRLLELPRWAYAVIGLIALAAALFLNYLNAVKFPLVGTLAAIVVYLATAWSLAAALARYCSDSGYGVIQSELAGGIVLVVVGAIAGGVGGAVWWLAAGPEIASLRQAVAGGAMLGALAILFLLGGP